MAAWQRYVKRLGKQTPSRVVAVLVVLFSLWVLADVFLLRWSSGFAGASYDAMVRLRWVSAPADPRIVVVDIDEASLARMAPTFGRWPWPRDTLATALLFLERQGPKAIVWDILFSDADLISPGGDAAFASAVQQSPHSHFSVVRLPAENDAASRLDTSVLPGLWLAAKPQSAPVAVIPPALASVAASRLGFSNGYPDADGVLRRYRYAERLADGSVIKSLPLSVLEAMDPAAARLVAQNAQTAQLSKGDLIDWRARAGAYRRISFADLFAVAESDHSASRVPALAGAIVVIGSTAPALHDIHPTPLSPVHPGLDVLATAIDNLLHQRMAAELPRWVQALLAIGLCAGIGVAVRYRSVVSMDPNLLLIALPASLMLVGYLSLNGSPLFLDLQLPAGLAVVFLGVLRYWASLRRDFWCSEPESSGPMLVWPLHRDRPWTDTALDRLIDALQQHAPHCRAVVLDVSATWPRRLRWPELACYAAIAGPADEMQRARPALTHAIRGFVSPDAACLPVPEGPARKRLAHTTLWGWAQAPTSDKKK